jgi:hypothetical protein
LLKGAMLLMSMINLQVDLVMCCFTWIKLFAVK